MWHKRQKHKDFEDFVGKRFRENIFELLGNGEVEADRTQELLDDVGSFANAMGSDEFHDLTKRATLKNVRDIARDLKTKVFNSFQWPMYVCFLTTWIVKDCVVE